MYVFMEGLYDINYVKNFIASLDNVGADRPMHLFHTVVPAVQTLEPMRNHPPMLQRVGLSVCLALLRCHTERKAQLLNSVKFHHLASISLSLPSNSQHK
jgi:hypothetical protein